MKSNAEILKKGWKKGLGIIEHAILNSLKQSAWELIRYQLKHKEYRGFTGNTQTSYACGIYIDGVLESVVTNLNQKPPVRNKLHKGQFVYLKRPYEGESRWVRPVIETDGGKGSDTSLRFLQSLKPPKNKICFVMTTGTEYSEYLEDVRNLDTLTSSYLSAATIMSKNWKPIPK